eukprot:848904-Amphidinium_carterae.1
MEEAVLHHVSKLQAAHKSISFRKSISVHELGQCHYIPCGRKASPKHSPNDASVVRWAVLQEKWLKSSLVGPLGELELKSLKYHQYHFIP